MLAAPACADVREELNLRLGRFQLWNECKPIDLLVGDLDSDAKDISLNQGKIETAVRSRLRSARIFDPEELKYLYVGVTVVDHAFNLRLDFRKPVLDIASDEIFLSATWKISFTGAHGKRSEYIMSAIYEAVDEFIDEYLRVNADACQ